MVDVGPARTIAGERSVVVNVDGAKATLALDLAFGDVGQGRRAGLVPPLCTQGAVGDLGSGLDHSDGFRICRCELEVIPGRLQGRPTRKWAARMRRSYGPGGDAWLGLRDVFDEPIDGRSSNPRVRAPTFAQSQAQLDRRLTQGPLVCVLGRRWPRRRGFAAMAGSLRLRSLARQPKRRAKRKTAGSPAEAASEASASRRLVSPLGIEPRTNRLRVCCSTN